MELNELKKQYSELAKKYKLPDFKAINEDFEIDKIDKETDCLLRLIRKVMMEKIVNSVSFLEILINPVNAPKIYINHIKNLNAEDRKVIDETYNSLSELSVLSLSLEVDYSEKKEAEIIKKICDYWNKAKPGFRQVLSQMNKPFLAPAKKERSYFG